MECEWLMPADAAQVVDNKLFVLGGGWDTLTSPLSFPFSQTFSIVAAFSVPWNDTNQRQEIEIEIADEDGSTLAKLQAQIEVGRPPGLPPGSTQRVQLTPALTLQFPKQGSYVIAARVGGEEARRVTFYVRSNARP